MIASLPPMAWQICAALTGFHLHHYAYHALISREHRTYIGEKRPTSVDAKLRWRSGPTAGQARKWVARLQRFLDVISRRQRARFAMIATESSASHFVTLCATETTVFSSDIHVTHPRLSFTFETDTRNLIVFRATLSFYRTDRNAERNVSLCVPASKRRSSVSIVFFACVLLFSHIVVQKAIAVTAAASHNRSESWLP